MADIATLVQQYLTIPSKPKRLNYYTVLGLKELLDDRTVIAVAIESAIEKLKSADRTTDPAGFEQVVKVVRQARATLLDDEKKQAYDTQLKSSLSKSNSTREANARSVSESSKLATLLPQGDPGAPFSMSDFLKQPVDQQETETAAQRHIALAEFARNSNPPTPSSDTSMSSKTDAEERSPNSNGSLLGMNRSMAGSNAGRELQELIRRNRQKKNMVAASIAIGGSLIVVLIGVWMFISNQLEQNKRLAKNANGPSLANVFQPNATDVDSNESINQVPGTQSKPRMNLGVLPSSSNETIGSLPRLGMGDEPSMASPENPKATPAMPPAPMNTPEPSPEPKMPVETAKPMASNADSAKWVEAIDAVRKTMNDKNFEKFGIEIEKTLNLAQTEIQEEQTKRLDRFGQLYQKGLEIASQAFSGLKAADEIKYGASGAKASVVESTDNTLILRISGKNEKFSYDKIPMGILMAVVEPKLNETPIDEAIRGILLSTGDRSNVSTKKQAKTHFDKAASLDENFAKLDLVLEETYK